MSSVVDFELVRDTEEDSGSVTVAFARRVVGQHAERGRRPRMRKQRAHEAHQEQLQRVLDTVLSVIPEDAEVDIIRVDETCTAIRVRIPRLRRVVRAAFLYRHVALLRPLLPGVGYTSRFYGSLLVVDTDAGRHVRQWRRV